MTIYLAHLAPVIRQDESTDSEVILTPITLWPLGQVVSVHVLPTRLVLDVFKTAVGLVAGRMRTIAGRYGRRHKGDGLEYFIALRDLPVSIKIVSGQAADVLAANVDVVRTDLGPFFDKIDLANQLNKDSTPLLTIKITDQESTGGTVLGICWGHILGDGASFNLFTTMLSTIYTHLLSLPANSPIPNLSVLNLPHPTTNHLSFASPSTSLTDQFAIPQNEPLSIAEGSHLYAEGMQGQTVVVRLSASETAQLKVKAGGAGRDGSGAWISTQDALSAWFVAILREACDEEIRTVTNSINYRSFPTEISPLFPVPLAHLVGNVAQMYATPIPPSPTPSLTATARALRDDLSGLRSDPQRTYAWLSVCADRLGRAADAGQMMCVLPRQGDVMVNSNLRYDWNVSFGCPPGSTSYHTVFSGHHMLRVFQPNPTSSTVGAVPRGAAELIFDVRDGLKDTVVALMEADRLDGWERYT